MILVLDLGSSSTRALIYDADTHAAHGLSARVPVTFAVDDAGRSEDDAVCAFDRVLNVLDSIQAQLAHERSFSPVTALGISTYASSIVCLDAGGRPLTPIFTYADTRCAGDARALRGMLNEMDVLARTGCRIRANYVPAKVAWIKRTMPSIFAQTHTFASLSDYVMLRLFGRMRAGISVASWSGLVNRQSSKWDDTWIDMLGIRQAQLPDIAGDGETLDGLLPQWRTRWPAFEQMRLYPPVGDGAAANIGSGCVDPAHIAVTIGTTAAMRVVRGRAINAPGGRGAKRSEPSLESLWRYRVDHGHDLIGGATSEGGNVIAWARKVLQIASDDALEAQVASVAPDAHGLTVLPMFAGERSPFYAEDIRATLHGLSLDTSPADVTRALMEAVAYRLAHVCVALRESGAADADARLTGSGGALFASPTWCQIIADVCGLPLAVADMPEATSRGVALLIRAHMEAGQSRFDRIQTQPDLHSLQTYIPNVEHHSIYQTALERQQELYAKLI